MKILALEFSSDARSVAVVESAGTGSPAGGRIAAKILGQAEQLAGRETRAFALVTTALNEAGLEREAIECVAVGLGPGSYTGIRLAIALAQGWQLANGVRTLGLSSADVLAWRAHASGFRGPGRVLIDAQRGEFYAAPGDWREDGPVLEPLRLARLDEAQALPGRVVTGEPSVAARFPDALVLAPDAATLGMLAAGREDFLTADQLEPVYLRAPAFVKAPPLRVIPPLPGTPG